MARLKTPAWELPRPRLLKIVQAFADIAQIGHAEIEGVAIDIRHPELPVDKWFAPSLGEWRWRDPFDAGPFVFPWQVDASHGRHPRDEAYQPIALKQGDRVRVVRVDATETGDPFASDADRGVRIVYFETVRECGTVVLSKIPVTFYRRGSFLAPWIFSRRTFENVAQRICDANGIEYLFGLCLCAAQLEEARTGEFVEDAETDEEFALGEAQALAIDQAWIVAAVERKELQCSEFVQTTRGSRLELHEGCTPTAYDIERIIDKAVALGYSWARYEARNGMQPLAEKGLSSKRGGAIGGKKSGETRRRKAAQGWQPHALELAIKVRQDDPRLSNDKVAGEIEAWWKLDIPAPSHDTLSTFVSSTVKEGKLPPRVRNPLHPGD